jgi:hypothetical protein
MSGGPESGFQPRSGIEKCTVENSIKEKVRPLNLHCTKDDGISLKKSKAVPECFDPRQLSVTGLYDGRMASRSGAICMVKTVKGTRCGTMVKKTHEERDMIAGVLVLVIDLTSLSQDVEYTLRRIKEKQEDSVLALEPKPPWEFGHRMSVLSGWNCFVARLRTKFRGAYLFLVFVHEY